MQVLVDIHRHIAERSELAAAHAQAGNFALAGEIFAELADDITAHPGLLGDWVVEPRKDPIHV